MGGIHAARDPIAVKRRVAYMPDTLGFYDDLTALENLMYVARLNGLPEHEVETRARQTMELTGLGNELHKKTSAYSRGMKQRLGLADVLLREPEVIILDEPTLGIDPAGIREFLSLIRKLSRQKGMTVLLSSHHLHQVQQVCDRVGIFVGGKLLAAGTIETLAQELFGTGSFEVTVSLREAETGWGSLLRELAQLEDIRQVQAEEHTIHLSCNRDITPDVVRLLVEKGLGVTGVQRKQYGLDEIYQRYFEHLNE
ncbi:putative ABC transporter ATP-binding protein YxlF [compost metagenome]